MALQHSFKNDFGNRLLPSVLDQIAMVNPNRFYASVPIADKISQGYQDVTFQQVKNAIDHIASSLSTKYGVSKDFTTICYIGEPDLRTAVVFLAAVKCGYKVLLVSPRNPVGTNISLAKQTSCKIVYHSALMKKSAEALKDAMPDLSLELLAPLEELIAKKAGHFEFSKTFEDAVNEPVLILHSSGSTDVPKPITMTHGTIATLDAQQNLRDIPGRRRRDFSVWNLKPFGRFYTVFPPFHLAGFTSIVILPIFSDAAVPVLGPGLMPPTGAMILEILQIIEIAGLFVVPSIIEQIAMIPGAIRTLQSLQFVRYAGGPLATAIGDQICSHVDLGQFYGATETMTPPLMTPMVEDWEYLEWHPDFKCSMEPSDDDTFELVYNYEVLDPYMTAILHNFPNLGEYRTKDLFKQHHSKPNLWRFHGRRDDIIVLANGEKFNPVPMEVALSGNSSITGAIVVGQGKSEASLLLEAAESVESESEWIAKVWPDIEKANDLLPNQGRIMKSRIIVSSSAKPFARASKGTIIRKLTVNLYGDELEALDKKPVVKKAQRSRLRARFDLDDIKELVSSIVISILSGRVLNCYDNLFAAGIDSLKSIETIELLRVELRPHAQDNDLKWLNTQLLYNHPSVDAISNIISDFLNNGVVPGLNDPSSVSLQEFIEEFTKDLPPALPEATPIRNHKDLTIGILGSRGFLGKAFIHLLLQDKAIASIVCMDRVSKQSTEHDTVDNPKLEYLPIDYTKADLGLPQQSLEEFLTRVDILIFNAWPVDFNLPLEAFTSNLQALRYLIDKIAATNKHRQTTRGPSHIVYISSIAAATTLSQLELSTGYGQSKFVAEQILVAAAQVSGIRSSILRVGQISPASQASTLPHARTWAMKEWFLALCDASQVLRAFPTDLEALDWIPVDSVSSIIKEIAFHNFMQLDTYVANTYTIVNPYTSPWSFVVEEMKRHTVVKDISEPKQQVQFIPLVDWLVIAQSYEQANGADQIQATKLLNFFQSLAHASQAASSAEQNSVAKNLRSEAAFELPDQTVSPTFAKLKSISREDIQDWMKQIFPD